MTMSTLVRRSGAVLTSAGVAAALTLLSPGAAHAAVQAQFVAVGQASASYNGPTSGGTCNLTSPVGSNNVESTTAAFQHGTKSRSVNLDATWASSDNSSDTVRVQGHVRSTLDVERRNSRDLKSFDLGVGGTVKINHSMAGSACSAQGAVFGATIIAFTEHKKGVLTLTRDTRKPGSILVFQVVDLTSGKAVTVDLFQGPKSHSVSRAVLKPGQYAIEPAQAGITAGGNGSIFKSAPRTTQTALTIHLQGTFTPNK
jgi:hypothetical protein